MKKSVGINVEMPKEKCDDNNCPFHGSLKCRGNIFQGTVISAKMHKTAIIGWTRKLVVKKYERYITKKTRIKVHNPSCINAKEGDIVKISQCRPLSKTKHFVIIKVMGREKGFIEKEEALTEGKFKKTKKEQENIKENQEEEKKENVSV